MMTRLMRWAREGSIAILTVVTMASAPTAAQAGWFDDVRGIGKIVLGTVMVGGGAAALMSADLAVAAGAAAIVGTAITGGAVLLIVAGAGLTIWGGYKLWKHFNGKDATTPTPPGPTRPGAGSGDPGSPGRVDPGRETGPGAGTPGSGSGTLPGGSSSTPGNNSGRIPGPRPDDLRPRPTSPMPGASGAGLPPGGRLPR